MMTYEYVPLLTATNLSLFLYHSLPNYYYAESLPVSHNFNVHAQWVYYIWPAEHVPVQLCSSCFLSINILSYTC